MMAAARKKASSSKPRSRPARSNRRRFWWARLDDEDLLDLRFCDLGLGLDRDPLRAHGDPLARRCARSRRSVN